MSDEKPEIPDVIYKALQGSGFPFQTAVAHVVKALGPRWEIYGSEFAWQGPRGEEHFLDLVATDDYSFLTIECKKTRKEKYIFLRPVGVSHTTGAQKEFRCLHRIGSQRTEIRCETWVLDPPSTCSEFCIVSTSPTGDQRLLEKDAGVLVRAAEAVAQHMHEKMTRHDYLFIPMIVTNATLYTARYRPGEAISLETGEFKSVPTEIETVSWVRFQKSFNSRTGKDLGERSVFVVTATSLRDFLELLKVPPQHDDDKQGVTMPLFFST